MSSLRMRIELAMMWLSFAGVIMFLSLYGSAHVSGAGTAQAVTLPAPEGAFDLWKSKGIHGKILILFDRHLNAAPGGDMPPEFGPDEFHGEYSVEALCRDIQKDDYGITLNNSDCSINMLNELIHKVGFYDAWSGKQSIPLDEHSRNEAGLAKGYRPVFEALQVDQQAALLRLNRSLIEAAYPNTCPKSTYHPTADNYIALAAQKGIIRGIFHIVPDHAWPEVVQTLSVFPLVYRTGDAFRMIILEAVPVYIMRIKDLPLIKENVLIHINGAYWNEAEFRAIAGLITNGNLKADSVTFSGNVENLKMADIGKTQ